MSVHPIRSILLGCSLGLWILMAQAAEEFSVLKITPADKAIDVRIDTAIQIHVSQRFDPNTISLKHVQLWKGKERILTKVSSDLGGVITLSPEQALTPQTEYRVEVTNGIQSVQGVALKPFQSVFRTGAPLKPFQPTLPPFQKELIATVPGMTCLVFGPNNDLYTATWEGKLLRWQLDPKTGKPISEAEVIWSDPKTRITALCFDPQAKTNNHLWMACDDNAGASTCELRFTARIMRFTLSTKERKDCIIGLPIGDHAISGLTFGPDGKLYFFCGAITMLGAEKKGARETLLSSAVLVADVRHENFASAKPIDVCTDAPTKYDPFPKDAPVRIFATGIREAYDLCWHTNGNLYAGVNQNDTAEKTPENKARKLPGVSVRPDEPLIRILLGRYYGQPNPARNEWVLLGGNPTDQLDPWEVPELPVGTKPEPCFDPELLVYNLVPIGGQSADGCEEWRGPGPLQNRLLICFYTTARTIHTFAFSKDGKRVLAEEPLSDAAGKPLKFGGPLDLCIDHTNSRIYVADFSDPRRKDSADQGDLWLVQQTKSTK